MKNLLFVTVSFVAILATSVLAFAQSESALSTPTRAEMESVIGGMDLSMGQKLSLRSILQPMQEQGEKVKADNSLSADQKTTQILTIRRNALTQTEKILTAPQQQQLTAIFLPKS